MKKLFFIFSFISMFVLSCLIFSGCNYQMLGLDYHYSYAYIKIGDEWVNLEIAKWTEYEGEQLQITLKDGTVMLVSSINCILYSGSLPNK